VSPAWVAQNNATHLTICQSENTGLDSSHVSNFVSFLGGPGVRHRVSVANQIPTIDGFHTPVCENITFPGIFADGNVRVLASIESRSPVNYNGVHVTVDAVWARGFRACYSMFRAQGLQGTVDPNLHVSYFAFHAAAPFLPYKEVPLRIFATDIQTTAAGNCGQTTTVVGVSANAMTHHFFTTRIPPRVSPRPGSVAMVEQYSGTNLGFCVNHVHGNFSVSYPQLPVEVYITIVGIASPSDANRSRLVNNLCNPACTLSQGLCNAGSCQCGSGCDATTQGQCDTLLGRCQCSMPCLNGGRCTGTDLCDCSSSGGFSGPTCAIAPCAAGAPQLSQTLTGLTPGAQYRLQWQDKSRLFDGFFAPRDVSEVTVELSTDGAAQTLQRRAVEQAVWMQQSTDTFTATATTQVLRFRANASAGPGQDRSTAVFIDNVALFQRVPFVRNVSLGSSLTPAPGQFGLTTVPDLVAQFSENVFPAPGRGQDVAITVVDLTGVESQRTVSMRRRAVFVKAQL
jgi:hypothetical protein